MAQWLPHYNYKWLLQDVIAGITIGVMLIPQGLAYAKIANIPVEHGLYSSWIPSALYFFLGTSKGNEITHYLSTTTPLTCENNRGVNRSDVHSWLAHC